MPAPAVPVLTAPTASGKSALALDVAARHGLEIVAADAFTVYRGLDIGTAKPTPAERALVPHHLLDVAEVTEAYDVARYVQDAEAVISDILGRGRLPLVVGGTGFYLLALTRGLPLTPPSDPARRAEVEAELAERGLDALLAEIGRLDPAEAARMERNPRRVVRALEVYRTSGRLPGSFGRRPPAHSSAVVALGLGPELHRAQIGRRVGEMYAAGWPAEAAWLAAQVDPNAEPRPTVWQALGYREALAVHRGELDAAGAARRVEAQTWQYARRQATFIRTQLGAPLLTPQEARAALENVLAAGRPPLE